MERVTISKREYKKLLDQAFRFEYLRTILQDDIFSPPPTKDSKKVMKEFRSAGQYSKEFLESLEGGLKRSSHFKK